MERLPPKQMAKKLVRILKKEKPDYHYLKKVFEHIRTDFGLKGKASPVKNLPKLLTEQELTRFYNTLWNVANRNHVVMIKLLLYSGVRNAELANMTLEDVDLNALQKALSRLDIGIVPDVVAVAVLDHGAAPASESQRLFRFRQLEHLLKKSNTLESFIFTPIEIPSYFTRMQAVVRSLDRETPLVLMDTGVAAVLGASLDKAVAAHRHAMN